MKSKVEEVLVGPPTNEIRFHACFDRDELLDAIKEGKVYGFIFHVLGNNHQRHIDSVFMSVNQLIARRLGAHTTHGCAVVFYDPKPIVFPHFWYGEQPS